jgi:hypothetical protein
MGESRRHDSPAVETQITAALNAAENPRNLLLEWFQFDPRNIGYYRSASIQRSDVCSLHQRVDADYLKRSWMVTRAHVVPTLWCNHFYFSHVCAPVGRMGGVCSLVFELSSL